MINKHAIKGPWVTEWRQSKDSMSHCHSLQICCNRKVGIGLQIGTNVLNLNQMHDMLNVHFAPVTVAPMINANVRYIPYPMTLTLTLILIIITLPWTKNPIITLILTLCFWRYMYHRRSNCCRSKCWMSCLNCPLGLPCFFHSISNGVIWKKTNFKVHMMYM